jgi:hypothetical protein
MDGKSAMYPGGFGDPAEDCNCRCAVLTRARWGLDEDELKTLQDRAKFFGLDKTEDFSDFKKKYLKSASEPIEKSSKSSTIGLGLQFFANKSIAKQKDKQLRKSIASWTANVEEHQDRIANPEKYYPDWDRFDERYRSGLIRHWNSEIKIFNKDIQEANEELQRREKDK